MHATTGAGPDRQRPSNFSHRSPAKLQPYNDLAVLEKRTMLNIKGTTNWAKSNIHIIISELDFSKTSSDHYLDMRDAPNFDADWSKAYEEIEKIKENLNVNEKLNIDKLSSFIRHKTYTSVLRHFDSPDLAGYVSDDFSLFSDVLAMGVSIKWVNGLLGSYLLGVPPCGEITPIYKITIQL